MTAPKLIYLGATESEGALLHEGLPLRPGAVLALERKRSPWGRGRAVVRVIVGSDGARADILLDGDGIQPEHLRFYHTVGSGTTDMRPLHADSTRLDGVPVRALDWITLHGGETITVASWRFRFCVDDASSRT